MLLPSPWKVAQYLWGATLDGSLLEAASVTLTRLLVGYGIGRPCCMDQWEGRTYPYPVRGHAMRTDSGRPSSSTRFSA